MADKFLESSFCQAGTVIDGNSDQDAGRVTGLR